MTRVKILQDTFYKKNFNDEDVFSLSVDKEGGVSFSRTYTIPELRDIAGTINTFLAVYEEKQNADSYFRAN